MACEQDVLKLLETNLGIGILPRSVGCGSDPTRLEVIGLDLKRSVSICAVSGRQRSCAAATLMKLLRAADWSRVQ